ncbi:MAG TPA: response regulator [Actinomycetota bacterium]|nr:response regulator [Actinomycetota bacterium]
MSLGGPPAGTAESGAAREGPPVRVMVVDDIEETRESLARLLERLGGIEVVGVAADGVEAVELVGLALPQVVVMDLRMPRMDGVEATRRIAASYPKVIVLILSAYGDESLVIEALMAGARGYLLKGASAAELADAIWGAAAGQARIAGQVTRPLLDKLVESLGRERETRQVAEEARGASEHLRRRQQQFTTMAAHELRTPITALLGSLATLERLLTPVGLQPQELALLTASSRQARRLARLVEDFMVVAKETSGGISVTAARVEIEQLIKSVVADLDHLGADRVRVSAAPGLWAWADPDRLAQVLTNLVRNALQYSPPTAPVAVVASSGPGTVQVAVDDHGPGIAPDKLPELFDRFGEHPAGDTAGLGVGLWIVRELLTAMGGNVWVEHNADGGSSFRIAIPAVEPSWP